jgi:S-adenosylmethionine:tRNA ribosyltransferase-isomerase
MHEERYHIPRSTASVINRALDRQRDVIAIGTTAVRALESAFDNRSKRIRGGSGVTDLYITPGFSFRAVNRMFTNFHTPHSTLLLLVSAFAGDALIREAYAQAIRSKYRLYSYGDAMYIQ